MELEFALLFWILCSFSGQVFLNIYFIQPIICPYKSPFDLDKINVIGQKSLSRENQMFIKTKQFKVNYD